MSFAKDLANYYTYADYEGWDTSVRCELIDGVVYMMSSPVSRHQRIVGKIFKAVDSDSAIQWLLVDGKYAEQKYARDENGSFVIVIQVLSISIML